MKLIYVNQSGDNLERKTVELIKLDGKYYIQLEDFQQTESVVELCLTLAKENDILKDRLSILEKKLSMIQGNE